MLCTGPNSSFVRTHLISVDDWSNFDYTDPESSAEMLQRRLLYYLSICVPTKIIVHQNGSHPWLNDRCYQLVAAKNVAEGTEEYRD